jgi:hypothetical protein
MQNPQVLGGKMSCSGNKNDIHIAVRSMIWIDERSLLIVGEEYSEDEYLSSFM